MRSAGIVMAMLLAASASHGGIEAQAPVADASLSRFQVVLVGTAGGPSINTERHGISTLVLAGREVLLFDAGRDLTTGLTAARVKASDVTKVFLTHLHSDHVISLPELWLFPWASLGRIVPLQVWGPQGTQSMMNHLREAFAFDVHMRRDIDEKYSPAGIRIIATDIREGVVYEANGVKVTAFTVDHGPVKPALGYRVDYRGHSVVMSGDTKPSDNLVKYSQGVDVLIHEVGRSKQDPAFIGPSEQLLPGGTLTRGQARIVADHHTDVQELAQILQRTNPRLAVFSHFTPRQDIVPIVRERYAGQVEAGTDMMTIDIGETVTVRKPESTIR